MFAVIPAKVGIQKLGSGYAGLGSGHGLRRNPVSR